MFLLARSVSAQIFLLLIVLGGMPVNGLTQDIGVGADVSRSVIESRIEEVQAATNLDEDTRAGLIEIYRRTLGFLETARSNAAAADAFMQARESAPGETQRLREELERAQTEAPTVKLDLASDASARDIEQRLQLERANQAAVSARVGNIDQQLAVEANRPAAVRQRLVEASQLSNQLSADLQLQPPPDELPLLTEARRWSRSTQAAAANAEMRMLDQELLSQGMRVDLLRAQRDSSARTLGRMAIRLTMLEELLVGQRRSETEQLIAESDATVLGKVADNPLIQQWVEANRTLGGELQLLTDKLETLSTDGNAVANKLQETQDSFQVARQRLEIAGLSQALSQVLHDQRRDLPDVREYRTRARARERATVETGLRDIRLEAEWRESEDITGYTETLLADVPMVEREQLSEPLRRLITSRRALLKNTIAANNEYLRALGDLDFQENQLQAVATEFKEFITGRVLNWSLSDEVLRLKVKVGVAYGGDIEKALDLVREPVAKHPVVLTDPGPLITFDEFGDNSLNITARFFIGAPSKRRETVSDINLAIDRKFRAAGIVIAFPQRDVHLDTSAPLDIRIQRD